MHLLTSLLLNYIFIFSRPERLRDIATRFGLDPEEALENVIYSRAYNSEHQMDLILLLAAKFAEEPGKYKVLVVDSIISLFRSDFSGRGELGERQQKLNQMLSRLTKISEEFNVAVFMTNQVNLIFYLRKFSSFFLALDDGRSWCRAHLCS